MPNRLNLIIVFKVCTAFLDYFGQLLLSVIVRAVLKYSIPFGECFSFLLCSAVLLYIFWSYVLGTKRLELFYLPGELKLLRCGKKEKEVLTPSASPFSFLPKYHPLYTHLVVEMTANWCEGQLHLLVVATIVFPILFSLNMAYNHKKVLELWKKEFWKLGERVFGKQLLKIPN